LLCKAEYLVEGHLGTASSSLDICYPRSTVETVKKPLPPIDEHLD